MTCVFFIIESNLQNLFLVMTQSYSSLQANVVCKQLGYSGAIAHFSSSSLGSVYAGFSYDDVKCTGTERTLDECVHSNVHNCGPNEGAGVECA